MYRLLQIAFNTVLLSYFVAAPVIAEEELLTGFRPKGCEKDSECLVTVLNVRSPDTLYVMFRDNRTALVRLIGVQSPIPIDNSAVAKIKEFLEMDKIFPTVKLEFDTIPRDKDDNLFAYVYYRGQMLNTWIISKKIGDYQAEEKNIKYQDKFKAIVSQLSERSGN